MVSVTGLRWRRVGGIQVAEVVLFHSVLGLRQGVISAAERLRAAGHEVHTPDLFDGEVFDDIDDGMRKAARHVSSKSTG